MRSHQTTPSADSVSPTSPTLYRLRIFQGAEELVECQPQAMGQLGREEQRGNGFTAFNVTDHVPRDAGDAGERIRSQPQRQPQFP